MIELSPTLQAVIGICFATNVFMAIMSYLLYRHHRDPIFRESFMLWLSFAIIFLMNPPTTNIHIIALNVVTWGFCAKYLVRVSEQAFGIKMLRSNHYKEFSAAIGVGVVIAALGGEFWQITVVPVLYCSFAILYCNYAPLKHGKWREFSTIQKLAWFWMLLYGLHAVTYPFNRLNLETAHIDFTFMLVNTIGFAITVPNITFNTYYKKINAKLEDQLELERKTVSTMVVTMNHELNTPLAKLQSLIDLIKIKQDLSDIDKAAESMEEIKRVIGKLSEIAEGDLKKDSYLSNEESEKLYKI